MDKLKECQKILELLISVIEANRDLQAGEDDRILDAEGLARKFFYHASSAIFLYRGTKIPELKISFVDPASINVLGRAGLETFLIFHHIFITPQSKAHKDFRYHS